jgi:hypothetical protein
MTFKIYYSTPRVRGRRYRPACSLRVPGGPETETATGTAPTVLQDRTTLSGEVTMLSNVIDYL